MANISTMSIKTAALNPYEFRAAEYKPKQYDPTVLERTLSRIEARQLQAVEKKGAVDDVLSVIEKDLYGKNKEQNQWWSDYKADIKKQIQHQIDIGEYGQAIRKAVSLAHSINTDSAVQGRLKASKEYNDLVETQRNRIGAKVNGIDQATFDWWQANNQYEYNKSYDNQGREVQGNLTNIAIPVSSLNIPQLFVMAAGLKEEEVNSFTKNISNSTMAEDNSVTGGHENKTDAYHRKQEKDIRSNIQELLANPDIQAQLRQQFSVDMYQLDKLQEKYNEEIDAGDINATNTLQQIEQYKKALYRNNQPITDYNQWLETSITTNPLAKSLSYNRTSTIRDNYSMNKNDKTKSRNNKGGGNWDKIKTTYWWDQTGAPIELQNNNLPDENKVNNSTEGITNTIGDAY